MRVADTVVEDEATVETVRVRDCTVRVTVTETLVWGVGEGDVHAVALTEREETREAVTTVTVAVQDGMSEAVTMVTVGEALLEMEGVYE